MTDFISNAETIKRAISQFAGVEASVMGLGSFGGGIAAANFLASHGARVLVSDQKTESDLAASIQRLDPSVDLRLGGHEWSHFENADLVVLNPAVPPYNEFVQRFLESDKRLTSEIELFCQLNLGKVIAVTGSNGKSTTTSFIHSMLKSAGVKCWLGGNIGVSLLEHVGEIEATDWVVLELSSFQLHSLRRIDFRPDIAVVTNLAANHLDWHETESHYFGSKQAIVDSQTTSDLCVLNATDSRIAEWRPDSRVVSFGAPHKSNGVNFICLANEQLTMQIDGASHLFRVSLDDRFPGEHNRLNLQAAIGAAAVVGLTPEQIQSSISQLSPLEFRLQRETEIDDVLFINDAKSTTPESAIAALNAFDRPIVLLAGGSDKGVDLGEFALAIVQRAKAVALMGDVASQLASEIAVRSGTLPTAHAKRVCSERFSALEASIGTFGAQINQPLVAQLDTFEASFRWAVEQAERGDIVLLSAGCASFGWFANYRDRGEQFMRLVSQV